MLSRLLVLIIAVVLSGCGQSENKSWVAENYYTTEITFEFEGETISVSNGGVRRLADVPPYKVTNRPDKFAFEYTPPLVHILPDKRAIVFVPTGLKRYTEFVEGKRNKAPRDPYVVAYLIDDAIDPKQIRVSLLSEANPSSTDELIRLVSYTTTLT